ncbi:centriolar coiled-coil protein of 110 kDa isoform X1 [Xyrauchen texanus]|uniref:centriolar coiled-coil protein of 110 kDa isoform X1 n=1 Tax=Xyrauchen texanus TaxID=154827 RepID=UPI002242957C|nr:centriolar coiled-coil protein of 110 kDa isoform X1 [Xyrauchen texanus]XP_051995858.1 centriolar coiled-coil protein of 110 kDa isoform X1 [Xyrauchen texanus]
MDSYEEFCARIRTELQSEVMHQNACSSAPAQRAALSVICFHARTILAPVLNEKQKREMSEYRKRATQREAERQIHYKNNIFNQIQAILLTRKAPKILEVPNPSSQHESPFPKTEHQNGFTMPDNLKLTPGGGTEPFILASKQPVTPSAEFPGVFQGKAVEEKQIQEEIKTGVSLQNLLKKSREFIEKEHGRQGSKVDSSKVVDPKGILSESLSDKENAGSLNGTASGLPSYIPCCSPPEYTSPSNLISPETNPNGIISARPHRGRPRPISVGNIFFSYPDNTNQSKTTANVLPQEVKSIATQDSLTSSHERRLLGMESVSMNRCDGQSRFNMVNDPIGRLETSPVDPELTSPLFRRRCHTLDSHLSSRHQNPLIDRSQERMPRFMAGVTARTPTRLSPPSPMNKTFTPESPVSAFIGSGISPESPSHAKLPFEIEGNKVISTALKERRTDEMQWQVHALEETHRSLEKDYAFRMPCFVPEQEREQLHLTQELEERVWRWNGGQGGLSPGAGDDECELRAAGERYPILSPMCPISPGDRSPRHSVPAIGFASMSLDVPSPSIQAPIYIRGLNHSTEKSSRNRLSQVITAKQQRALCRLSAIVKGFLTRRLLKTDKIKHLCQTVQDTQEFIRSFRNEAPQRNEPLSEQDLSLQERVRAQLRAALFDIHDVFFTMTLEERLSLLQQDRDLRTERKLREMEKAKSTKDKMILSAATQKSLDRKKQSRLGESPGQTRRSQKNKSPPTKRILQPSQGQNAPVSVQQLPRRGSYKKTPADRVQHSERLKKQNSLG